MTSPTLTNPAPSTTESAAHFTGEFETAHIPGSYNVPLNLLGEHADEIRSHLDVPVVIICRSGNRAAQANRTLAGAGMSNTHILEGGLMGWDNGSRPLQRGEARWDIERQVRMVAELTGRA